MADNNRLELDIVAVDDTAAATTKAKANFRSVEQEAGRAAASMGGAFDAQGVRMARSIETASNTAMRSLEKLEARAALAGKSGVDRLIAQRSAFIQNLGADEPAIQRAVASFDKLITARQKYEDHRKKMDEEAGHGGHSNVLRRTVLGVKDFFEGRTQGTIIEGVDVLVGTSGGGGILPGAIKGLSEVTGLSQAAVIGVGSLAAAFVGLEVAGVSSMHRLAEQGVELQNISLRTGLQIENVQAFQYAAKAAGQKPDIIEKLTRGLAEAASDTSPAGKRGRSELERLGVNFHDQFGDLKPTEQLLLDVGDAINKLPPGLQRSAASMEIFKRIGIESVPFLSGLRENLQRSGELGKTFDSADAELAEKYHHTFTDLGEQWDRLKLKIEGPLAVFATVNLQGLGAIKNALQAALYDIPAFGERAIRAAVGSPGLTERPNYAIDALGQKHYIGPPSAELAQKGIDRFDADAKIRALQSSEGLQGQLEEAKKALQAIPSPELGVTKGAEVDKYTAARARVKQLEDAIQASKAGGEAQIAAIKDRAQLQSQLAEVAESAKQKEIGISLGKNELAGPEDVKGLLDLADARVRREQEKALLDKRYRVGENGQKIDLIGTAPYQAAARDQAANFGPRQEVEYAKVMQEITDHDQKYFQSRTDADGKAWEEAIQRRRKAEQEFFQDEQHQRELTAQKSYDIRASVNDRERDLALQQLGIVDAQSLKDKQVLEQQKFNIETYYAQRSLGIQIDKLEHERTIAVGEINRRAAAAGVSPDNPDLQADIRATNDRYQQDEDALRQSSNDKILIDAQRVANEKGKLQIEENRKVFESIKSDAAGLFDQLVSHTKSWADFAKDIFKSTILTPIKGIFSSQVAGLFTELLTGQKVSFGEVGSGQGAIGKLGSVLGRAGLGQPQFGVPHELANINQPNHIGDVSLVSGAIPVVITNAAQVGQEHARSSGSSYGAIAAGLGGLAPATVGAGAAVAGGLRSAVTSTINYAGGGGESFGYGPATPSSLGSFGQVLPGAPEFLGAEETSGLAPEQAKGGPLGALANLIFGMPQYKPYTAISGGGSGGGGGGILGGVAGIGGGFLNSIGHLFGFGSKSATTGDLGSTLPSAPAFTQGFLGHLGFFAKSPAAALLGGVAAFDGIRRGGVLGSLEAAGGGAAVGFKFGGPLGALIGAGIGGGIAAIKSAFFKGDRQHAKDLAKQVYGMGINDATADQIVAIAKQSYGGQIDVAVRSPEVRKILSLYAQTLGDTKAQAQFVADTPHAASFVESGGQLSQQAQFVNGNAYSYQSPLSVAGGLQTTLLPSYGPMSGGTPIIQSLQLHVGDGAASDLFDGRIAQTVNPGYVQQQSVAGSQASIGRSSQQTLTLQPSAITR